MYFMGFAVLCVCRYFHWYFAIYSMLFMVIVLTPFYIIYFILSSRSSINHPPDHQ